MSLFLLFNLVCETNHGNLTYKKCIQNNTYFQELEALCYSAACMGLPEKYSIEEEKAIKAKQYYDLLKTSDGVQPDPLEIGGWQSEADAMKDWPKLYISDLTIYLLSNDDKDIGRRMLSDYKVS